MKKVQCYVVFAVMLMSLFIFVPIFASPLVTPMQPEVEWTPEMQAKVDEKVQDVVEQNDMYNKYMTGKITQENYEHYLKNYTEHHFSDAQVALQKALEFTPEPLIRNNSSIIPYAIGDGYKEFLNGHVIKQEKDYYCGPASAKMVVDRYHGYSVYSQDQLANMLGTTGNGTGLGNNWLNVLNRNVMGRNYTVVSGSSFGYSNWIKFLTDSAIQSIYYGRGVIYDVYMNPYADNYLEGYVWGDNMYHYVAGCGYDAQNPSARKLTYVDPINDSAMRPKAQGTHTVPARMVARATHPMGAVL